MSELVEFEDLATLDPGDLRAVLGEVEADRVLEALAGAGPGLRRRLLSKLPHASAERLEAAVLERGPVPEGDAAAAQRRLVEALCRLSRHGHVAFDDPEDMIDP